MQQLSRKTFLSPQVRLSFLQDNLFLYTRQVLFTCFLAFSAQASSVCVDLINEAGKRLWVVDQSDVKAQKCALSRDFIQWMSLRTQPQKHTFQDYRQFILSHQDWPRLWELCAQAEKRLETIHDSQILIEWFSQYPPRSVAGHFAYLNALQSHKTQQTQYARHMWRTIMLNKTERSQFLKQYGSLLTTEDHYERYRLAISKRLFEEAQASLPFLPADDREAARYRLQLASGKLNFNKLPPKYQKNRKFILDHLNNLKKSDPAHAIDEFLKFKPLIQATAPSSLYFYIAREAIDFDQPQKAYQVLEGHTFSEHLDFIKAEELMGWIACDLLKQPKKALVHLERVRQKAKHSSTKAQAEFWIARCYEELQQTDEAQKWYKMSAKHPASFYGQMALQKLGKTFSFQGWNQRNPQYLPDVQTRPFAQLAKIIAQSDFSRDSYDFLYLLFTRAKTSAEKFYIMDLAHELGSSFAIDASRSLGGERPLLETKFYPVQWITEDHDTASLSLALIRQESSFNPRAISSVGAIGLMQLMPETAKLVAQKLKIPFKIDDLKNPEINARLGTHYIQERLNQFNSHLIPAIASYNAGPTPVARWIEKRGYPSDSVNEMVRWIEHIPYSQTREYVKHVLSGYTIYKHLLAVRAQKK